MAKLLSFKNYPHSAMMPQADDVIVAFDFERQYNCN